MMHSSILKGWVGRGALSLALVLGAVAVFLMTGGLGEGQERCPADTTCIDYAENGSGAVPTYAAVDPEKKDVTWTLVMGADILDFGMDAASGRLTFNTPPDYENPMSAITTGALVTRNVYNVTIGATDADADLATDYRGAENTRPITKMLRVTVTNVDEAGEVTLNTLQPQVGTPITAMLTDPDGKVLADDGTQPSGKDLSDETATTKWQWSRSARVTGGWTDIEDDKDTTGVTEGKTKSYRPTKDDVGMYLRATATYDDGEGKGKSAQTVSANPVQADPSNKAPEFLDAKGNDLPDTTRSVAENSAAGTAVGAPVAATDPGIDGRQETLTYTLSGADSRDFEIDSGTGQIRVKAELNYEDDGKETRRVTVAARDPGGEQDTVSVTIKVTDVDEAPTITAGSASVNYNENASAGTEVARYTANDPDGDNAASLKWSLSGQDAARFAIGNRNDDRGWLTFREVPDYEAPTDSDRNNIYNMTVEVTDRGGSKATRDVTVHVKNVEERGVLTVSNLHPQVGTRITPTLVDPDTPISNLIWTWEIDNDDVSTANAYTPKPGDANKSLEVSVAYTDGTGERQTLSIDSFSSVDVRSGVGNSSPRFPANTPASLTVRENESSETNVGDEVTATDSDSDDLTYSMSGGDSAFSIDQVTGQIETTVRLDHEKKSSYRVTVTAEDPSGDRDTHSLTIAVTDEDEAPAITSGDSYIYYAENGRGNVAVYRAEDPEGNNIVWTLTGTNDDKFTIAGGVLKFKTPPDYTDGAEYNVTVNAGYGDSDNTDTEAVTISIINLDEAGKVELSTLQPREGTDLTATLTDPDEGITGRSWQWARGTSRTGTFTDIKGETNETYEPVNADTGKYLRVTVTYMDAQGGGKSASVTSTGRTLWLPSPEPKFLDPDGEELPTATREVNENAKVGTNVGAPVAATDIKNDRGELDRLTYTLSGDDVARFTIDNRTGQIKVNVVLDHEADAEASDNCKVQNMCEVMVTATDPSGDNGTINVTIEIVKVNEPPELTFTAVEGSNPIGAIGDLNSGFKHPEPVNNNDRESDDTSAYPRLSIAFVADDPETPGADNNNNLTWTLAGTDADDFVIGNNPATSTTELDGALTFKSGPDFEAPTDSGQNNVYEVTVQAADAEGNTASERVKITVGNVGEKGDITLSHTQPETGARLTASLADADKASSISWQWYRGTFSIADLPGDSESDRCSDTKPNGCLIYRATSLSYIPKVYPDDNTDETTDQENTDVEDILTVVARYSDREGKNKTTLKLTGRVRARPVDENNRLVNTAPEFQEGTPLVKVSSTKREVCENETPESTASRVAACATLNSVVGNVGEPVDADDADDAITDRTDTLFYTLSGTDARYFEIDSGTGQITVLAGTKLDYETKKSYRVTVRATDPSLASGTVTVTIEVKDVDEVPALSRTGLVAVGRGSISYPENGRNTVAEYSALGPNAARVSWRLSGSDASDFTINSRGALTFRSTPNFESPADADRDNRYELTVTARSGRDQDSLNVTVDVYNLDEEGEVALSPTRGVLGSRITAEVTDPDGDVSGISWEWARSVSGRVGWTPIPGTNSHTYTPDSEDAGYYLQATAYYSDSEGGGKSSSASITAAVRPDDDGRVTLTPASVQVGTSVTARLTDPDGNVRNVEWQWASSESRTSGWLDIPGATSSTYTTIPDDLDNFLRATASYDDGDGPDKVADTVTTSAVVEDDDGVVTLSSPSPTVGETVTATLTDPDGGVTRATWQWATSSNGTSNWTNMSGTNSRTYTVAAGDLGKYLRATVIYDDAAGPGKSAEAITAAAVTEDDDGSVTLSPSSPEVGETITAVLSDPDGRVTGVTWTWAFSSNGTTNWRTIIGANSSTYTTVAADVRSYLRATASYTDAAGPGKSAEAVTTAAVTEDDDGSVTLSSTGTSDGDRVTATLTDPDGRVTGITWQWASSPNGSSGWLDILNATSATYTPITTDVGRYLRATATYTDAVGPGKSAEAVTAAAVTPDDDGTVTFSTRTPEVGSAITATLSDPDGGVTGETWQWAKSSNGSTGWTNIQGATSASYTPGRSDAGAFLRATASYDDAVGTGKSAQAATSSGVAQMELLSEYDANRDGSIERSEAIRAVSDYFGGQISKDDVLAVLVLYFSG